MSETHEPAVSLDDRLLRRTLGERMFGRSRPVLIGRYEVLDRIGGGGMGTVYRARDPELSRTVALKLIRPDRIGSQWRMLNEARALARLSHPNVVTVHEVGTHEGRVFVAMEYVSGQTLRAWLEKEREPSEIFAVLADAARGLAAAHASGVVHRDFKPDNVIVGDDGRVRVADFGVAKTSDEPRPDTRDEDTPVDVTATGQLLGTPAYMAAEQFMGGEVDARTDVFAWCVVLYEALSGRRPFVGRSTEAVAQAVLRGEVSPLPANAEIAALVERGLSSLPDVRPSLAALVDALEPAAPKPRWWIGAVAVIGLCGIVIASQGAPAPDPEDDQERFAFEAIGDGEDEDAKLSHARAFLERFGTEGDPARRAVAHATAGEILWRRSCAEPWMDLCLIEEPIEPGPCLTPSRGALTRVHRDHELAELATEHFRAASKLAGTKQPEDPSLAEELGGALGLAKTRLADAELEVHLSRGGSKAYDFRYATELSKRLFVEELQRGRVEIGRFTDAYRSAAEHSQRWSLVAVSRVGLVWESLAIMVADVPVPLSNLPDETCEFVVRATETTSRKANWTECVERAERWGLQALPEAEYCAERVSR